MLWARVCFESGKDLAFVSPEEFKLDTKQFTHGPCEGPTVTHKGAAALFPSLLVKALSCNAGTPKPILGENPHICRGGWTECSPHCSSPCWSLYKVLRDLQLQDSLGDAGTEQSQGWVCCFLQVTPLHCGLSLTQFSNMSLFPNP